MVGKRFAKSVIILAALLIACPSWAAHPLITDDSGTQGKGKFQLELTGQYDWNDDDVDGVSAKYNGTEATATLSYGILDAVDLVLSLPYLWEKKKNDDVTVYDESGIGDMVLEAKWRLFEQNGFSLGLKPGISVPTGDEDKGLGTGKLAGQIFLIVSQEVVPIPLISPCDSEGIRHAIPEDVATLFRIKSPPL